MINIKKKLILTSVLIAVCGFATSKAYAVENKKRISGNDRYQTAIAVSQDGWKSSDTVILANGQDFPDALCASPLARKYKAPILLTPSTSLDPGVESEIQRLGAKKIIIVGGAGVVSSTTESKLKGKGIEVSRFSGKDRFETSLAIAKEVKGTGSEIAVVSSEGFADALSVAPIAANRQMPIILLPKHDIPINTEQYIKENNITKTYVIGGKGVLSDSLVSDLPGFERVSGLERYETNTAVLDRFASDVNFETAYMASGENFPDALACSALAPVTSSPIILTSNYVPNNTMNLVKDKFNNIINFKVIGGTGVIPDYLVKQMIPSFGIEYVNTASNLVNFGLAAESNGWIYYTNQSDYQRIYKMKIGDSKGQKLSDDPYASHLNVIDDWIYYVDSQGGLCKMKTDGSGLSLLTDYPVKFMQVTSDYIYFLTSHKSESDGNQFRELHRIKPDGSNDETVLSYLSSSWDYLVVDNDIYFLYWEPSTQTQKLLRMGSFTDILNNVDKFVISDNHIYYINHEDKCIYKADMDGKNIGKITSDTTKSLNIANGWIYYANTSDNNKLYKITTDGKDKSKVADIKSDYLINIAGGKLFYVETNTKFETYIMNKDGSAKSKSLIDNAASFTSEDNEYYYVNTEDSSIYKTDSYGNNIINLNQMTTQNIQISNGWIYYSNSNDNNKLYKMKTDGSSNTKVSDSSSGDFKLSGEYLYYVNVSDNNHIYKIKTDGTENTKMFYDDIRVNRIWLKNNYLVFTQVPLYSDGTTVMNTWTYVFNLGKQYAYPERLLITGNIYNLSIVNDTIYYNLIDELQLGNIKTYNITDKSETNMNITPVSFTADETGIYYLSAQKDSLGYIIKTDLKGNNPIKTQASPNAFNLYINDNQYLYQTIDLSQMQYISNIN